MSRVAVADEPPHMDVRVRMVFDENLKSMIFPKVKSFIFRVQKDATFEVAAKALANKNEHPHLWQSYTFSIL